MIDIEQIDSNIYFLKGYRSSNIFYLDFEKKAIVDSGHKDNIRENIDSFYKFGIDLTEIDYIITTHCHSDHIGAHIYLKSINPKIKIICSKHLSSYINNVDSITAVKDLDDKYEDFGCDIIVGDGDKIDLGGCVLKVIETKGHTKDSISFFSEQDKFMFSGDCVYYHLITHLDHYQTIDQSINEQTETLLKIRSIKPKIMFTGHGESIKNTEKNLEYCLKKIKRLQKNNEMFLVNNLIPTMELIISRNQSLKLDELKTIIINNLMKVSETPFFKTFDKNNFEKITEKSFALMNYIDIISIKDGDVTINKQLNKHIDSQLQASI